MMRLGPWLYAFYLLCACGTPSASRLSIVTAVERPDNDAKTLAAVLSEFEHESIRPRTGECGALLVLQEGDKLRMAWAEPPKNTLRLLSEVVPESRPDVHGDLVVTQARGMLVAVSASTGEVRFQHPLPLPVLVGTAGNDATIFAVTRSQALPYRFALTALSRDGDLRFEYQAEGQLGKPLATERHILVPLLGQSLAVLDAASGEEVARVRSNDDVITWVARHDGSLFFGDRHVHGLTPHYDGARDSVPGLDLPLSELPGRPTPYPSAYAPVPARHSAHGRIGVYFVPRMQQDHALSLLSDELYLVFFRHIYGLSADGHVRFAQRLPYDVLHAEAVADGLLLLDNHGGLTRLRAQDGALQPILSANATIATSGLISGAEHCGAGTVFAPPLALREGLRDLVTDTDGRLSASRLYALSQLAKLQSPAVTSDLLAVIRDKRTPVPLAQAARAALLTRQDGADVLLAALAEHDDYLAGTDTPPIALLAETLADQGVREAAPLLQERLFDEETPADALPAVAQALATLDPQSATVLLQKFLSRYRADSTFADAPDIWLKLAQTWMRLHPPYGSAQLETWVKSPSTEPMLVAALETWLTPQQASSPPSLPEATAPAEDTPTLPYLRSQDALFKTLNAQTEDWQPCVQPLRDRLPELHQLRMAMVVDGEGRTHHRHYTPHDDAVASCLDAKLERYRFPQSRTPRQLALFTVELASRQATLAPPTSSSTKLWWTVYKTEARSKTPSPRPTPWWQDQNPMVVSVEPEFEHHSVSAVNATVPAPSATLPQQGESSPVEQDAPPEAWWLPQDAD